VPAGTWRVRLVKKERGVDRHYPQWTPRADDPRVGENMLASSAIAAAANNQADMSLLALDRDTGSRGGTSLTSVPASVDEQYIFVVLAGQEYALKAGNVQSVERLINITPVPNTAAWVLGVVHLHGAIVSVVDLRRLWGLEAIPPTSRTRLVVAQAGEMVVALVVDSVVEMRAIPQELIQEVDDPASLPPWVRTVVSHVAAVNDRAVLVLDVERLLYSEQMQQYVVEE